MDASFYEDSEQEALATDAWQHIFSRREFLAIAGGAVAVLAVGSALKGNPNSQSAPAEDPASASAAGDPTTASAATEPVTDPANPADPAAEPAPLTLADLPWNLQLINGEHPLDPSYEPPQLTDLPQKGQTIDSRVYADLMALLEAAEAAGVPPVICSAFRPYEYQQQLFANRVERCETEEGLEGEAAEKEAAFWVARPGASEHQAGLAVDLIDQDYTELDEAQENTETQQWLIAHCAEFGFILRYPTDKSAVTGIGYEPWHYRYVGREFAPAITESGLCFEEWLQNYLADAQ
ncbi:MAG: M15 family metallopeptidase [Eggerthellaceae bacterium]|nr:M15 family metallopeptidase [Eggerthellaceae bacterium]